MYPESGSAAHRDDSLEIVGVLQGIEEGDGAAQGVPDQDHVPVVPLPDVCPQPLDVVIDAGAGLPLGMAREIDGVGE